jgi:predicted RecA/RadA family phage recombinase
MSAAGERVELARYQLRTGERVLYGQRIDGTVAVVDVPAGDHGRVYLIERHLESKAAADYLTTSHRRGAPGAMCPTVETLAEGTGD